MIVKLYKRNKTCSCGCNKNLPRLDKVSKINGKYFTLYCGMIYRIHSESVRRIRLMAKQVRISNG